MTVTLALTLVGGIAGFGLGYAFARLVHPTLVITMELHDEEEQIVEDFMRGIRKWEGSL